jgi:hypothetical protein
VQRANEVRETIKTLLNQYDAQSKAIAALPLASTKKQAHMQARPQAEAVVANVRRAAILYIQKQVMAIQHLPTKPTPAPRPAHPNSKPKAKARPRKPTPQSPQPAPAPAPAPAAELAVFLEQRGNIVGYLDEARRAGETDAVEALSQSLADIEDELARLGWDGIT